MDKTHARTLIRQQMRFPRSASQIATRVVVAYEGESLADFFEKRAHLLDYSMFPQESLKKVAYTWRNLDETIGKYYAPAVFMNFFARKLGAVLDRVLIWGKDKWSRLLIKAVDPQGRSKEVEIDGVIIKHPKTVKIDFNTEIPIVEAIILAIGLSVAPKETIQAFVIGNKNTIATVVGDWVGKKSNQPVLPERVGMIPGSRGKRLVDQRLLQDTQFSPGTLDASTDAPPPPLAKDVFKRDPEIESYEEKKRRAEHQIEKIHMELEMFASREKARVQEIKELKKDLKKYQKIEDKEFLEGTSAFFRYMPSPRDVTRLQEEGRQEELRAKDLEFELKSLAGVIKRIPKEVADRKTRIKEDHKMSFEVWKQRQVQEKERRETEAAAHVQNFQDTFLNQGFGFAFDLGRFGKYAIGFRDLNLVLRFDATFAIHLKES